MLVCSTQQVIRGQVLAFKTEVSGMAELESFVADVWPQLQICIANLDFEFALGRPLGGSWQAGLALEVLPRTVSFTPLHLSPIDCT